MTVCPHMAAMQAGHSGHSSHSHSYAHPHTHAHTHVHATPHIHSHIHSNIHSRYLHPLWTQAAANLRRRFRNQLKFLTQHLVSRKRATPSKSSASSIARSEWSEAASSVIPPDVVTLSEAHKAAIVETAALMAQQGLAITMQMYRTLMVDKDLWNIFSFSAQSNGIQQVALAQAIYGYTANINDLTPLLPTVIRIAEKHAALGVKPEHYSIVADHLMPAIRNVLGSKFTPALQEAWYHGYWQLARIFIDVEAKMYASAPWDGFQEFKVARRVQEAERVISLDLVPVDPDMLPLKPYRAGAFVTARIWIEDLKCWQNRHYSLSDAQSSTGDHYRMTVKRVDGDSVGYCPPGLVSNALDALPVGGTVLLSAPTGSFVLPDPLPENIVFFSAGIGVTSNIAMLNAVSGENPAKGPRISWIQSMPTPDTHIFKDHVADLASRSAGKIRYKSFYTEVEGPLAIRDKDKHTHFGRVDVLALDRSLLALHDRYTHYFLCGPDPFMKDVRRDLEALGVNSKRINIEAFRAGELVD